MVLLSAQDPFHLSFGKPLSFPSWSHNFSNLRAPDFQRGLTTVLGSRPLISSKKMSTHQIPPAIVRGGGIDQISPIGVNPRTLAVANGNPLPLEFEL